MIIRDETKYEIRKCKHPDCNIEFECYKKSKKQYCSKKCSSTSPIEIAKRNATTKKTIQHKYNGIHYMANKSTQEKHKKSMYKKYGVEHALQDIDIKNKMLSAIDDTKRKNMISKSIDTKMRLYGRLNGDPIKRRIKKYNIIKTDWKHLTPLFSVDDIKLHGISSGYKYRFKCNVCGSEFDRYIDCGYIPRCKPCAMSKLPHRSKGEIELVDYIKSIKQNIIIKQNVRNIVANREIDIYLPEYNLAIEYDGIIWHSELFGKKDKKYHIHKTKMCAHKGIQLIHIYDCQWELTPDIVKSIISSKLNIIENKIESHDCNIKEVNPIEKNIFLKQNHIMGKCYSKINIGLYNNNNLIFLLTFGKSRYDIKYDYELLRIAVKNYYYVNFGFETCLKYFIDKYNPKSIITYVNRNLYVGNLYFKNKFNLLTAIKPNYHYIRNDAFNLFSRELFQKHLLKDKLDKYDDTLSEWENMKLNDYDRIWDCGSYKFVLNIE